MRRIAALALILPARHQGVMTELKPTWYATTAVEAPARSALSQDLDVDVCVIGAGLAGLTVAREVARRGWSVAVLEAATVGAGASGRNGGAVSPGFSERVDAIVERVGPTRARELWTLSEGGVEYIRSAIAESEMPGVALREGRLKVSRVDEETRVIEQAAMLRVDFGADVEAWPVDQVREVLRSPAYFQALHYPKAFHIHPLNYLLGLAASAEKFGARIFENTAALSVDPAGVRKRVQTEHHMVRAHHVVLAASVGAGSIDAELGHTVQPVATYMAVSAPLGEELFDAIRYTGAVSDTRRAGDYYRVVADDRLLWGSRISTRTSEPWRLKQLMRHDILKTFRQLSHIEIETAWTGVMAYAVHKMPQIGELSSGFWLCGAFGGHGLNTTAMAGELIASAILEGDDRWRLFSSYELVWAGGRAGRTALQSVYWAMRARDALHEKIARYRDRARRESMRQQEVWAAEQEARRVETEKRHAEEKARQEAEREERKRAAEEARRLAAERAQKAKEEAERVRQEAARAREEARVAEELARAEAKRAEEEAARAAAVKAVQDTADAAIALARQLEEHKAVTEAAAAERAAEMAVALPEAERAAVPDAEMPATLADVAKPAKAKKQRKRKKKEAEAEKEIATSAAGPAPDVGT